MEIGIIFPVYNEEDRLEAGIRRTEEYIKNKLNCNYHIYIVDNASDDRTEEIGKILEKEYSNLTLCKISQKGVGAAFRKGVAVSAEEIIGYMDVDLSTDISYLRNVENIFLSRIGYEIVNASRFGKKSNANGRKWYRNITSYGLIILLKIVFGMKASDAICGFKFFKRETVLQLMSQSSQEDGWFYMIELLLRAEKGNCRIYELPVRWDDETTDSKVQVFEQIKKYIIGIIRLKKQWR